MNEEVSTEVIQEEVIQEEESAADPEILVEGSAPDSEILIEVETEVEIEEESEEETEEESEEETEEETEVLTKEDLEELKESIISNNESVNDITTMLLESQYSDTPDYTEILETLYQEDITFNNNFCLGIESLLLGIGILSGLIFGFVFRSIFKR